VELNIEDAERSIDPTIKTTSTDLLPEPGSSVKDPELVLSQSLNGENAAPDS
jgi:hypothetical protein